MTAATPVRGVSTPSEMVFADTLTPGPAWMLPLDELPDDEPPVPQAATVTAATTPMTPVRMRMRVFIRSSPNLRLLPLPASGCDDDERHGTHARPRPPPRVV